MSNSNHENSDVISAFQQVQQAVNNLRTEYTELTNRIEIISAEIKALPNKTVPFEDLKAGILDLVDAAGARYAESHIKPALEMLATGHEIGSRVYGGDSIGKPVTYMQLMDAIDGKLFPMAFAGVAQPHEQDMRINNGAFHFFFGEQIKAGLKKVMDAMEPADFGYAKIHPDKVGTDREARKAEIDEKEAELEYLHQRRGEISEQLKQLGVRP